MDLVDEIKQEPADGTDVHVDTVITDELDIKVEYDSDVSIDTEKRFDDNNNLPDSCVTATKRKPSPGSTGTLKKPKHSDDGDDKLHKWLCNLEIELLRTLIEKERVKVDYDRSISELKLQRLDMKMCLQQM